VVTPEERKAFGWLGTIPKEIVNASRTVTAKYKKLSARAGVVARMPQGPNKIKEAQKVESDYYALIEMARRETCRM
jgi:hypothetical protein